MNSINHNHRQKPGTWLMRIGLLLLAAALLLTGYNLWDEMRANTVTQRTLAQMPQTIPAQSNIDEPVIPDYILNPDMEMPTVEIEGNNYIGTLEIPAFKLSLPVISQWSYPRLRLAPCRYTGSAYQGNLVIAAHNYRAHFGPLKNLYAGDRITFTDADGNLFTYNVVEIQVLEPTAIEDMTAGDWDLTLFTCTPGGQTRLTVRCEAIETALDSR